MSVATLFPYGLFQPSANDGDPGSGCVLADVTLPSGLRLIAKNSDPYDKITYLLDGKPIASEYVGSFEDKLDLIRSNQDAFLSAIQGFGMRRG
ncbi:hypothetical protein D3C86_1072470 [compost metagenome]